MKHKLSQAMGLALAGLLAMAPIGLAAGTAGTTGERPGSSTSTTTTPGTTQMQRSGTSMQGEQADSIHATVQRVDARKHTVELKATGGERIKLPAPSQMLSELKPGDMVEVTIHKTSGARERGTTATPQPGSSGAIEMRPGPSSGAPTDRPEVGR
jgi:hypothetical protein